MFPNTASLLQRRLGLEQTECPSFDVSAACTGFITGLNIANSYIRTGSVDYILLVSSESITRLVDWQDRNTCVLFGDGAGAVVLGVSDEPGIYSTHCYIQMRGNEVFKIAVNKLGEIVDEALAYNKLDKSDIDWLVPHQANLRIIKATAKKLHIPLSRVILTIQEHGNTSSASIPLALDLGIRDGRIKRGDMLLLEAFGAGLAWGAALIKY